MLYIIRDWDIKVGSQEISRITGKFSLVVKMKQGKGRQSFVQKTHWS